MKQKKLSPARLPAEYSRDLRSFMDRWKLPAGATMRLEQLSEPRNKAGRPALQISIGTVVKVHYLRSDFRQVLKKVLMTYRSHRERTGSIDAALSATRTHYRKRGCWFPKDEWSLISAALRGSRRVSTSKLSAELAVLSIHDHRTRATLLARLLNRRLFHVPKSR